MNKIYETHQNKYSPLFYKMRSSESTCCISNCRLLCFKTKITIYFSDNDSFDDDNELESNELDDIF